LVAIWRLQYREIGKQRKRLHLHMQCCSMMQCVLQRAVSLNVEHELTRQRKWDKQETQEYM